MTTVICGRRSTFPLPCHRPCHSPPPRWDRCGGSARQRRSTWADRLARQPTTRIAPGSMRVSGPLANGSVHRATGRSPSHRNVHAVSIRPATDRPAGCPAGPEIPIQVHLPTQQMQTLPRAESMQVLARAASATPSMGWGKHRRRAYLQHRRPVQRVVGQRVNRTVEPLFATTKIRVALAWSSALVTTARACAPANIPDLHRVAERWGSRDRVGREPVACLPRRSRRGINPVEFLQQ